MAVAFRAVSAEVTTTSGGTITIAKPTGTVADDVMFAVFSFFHNNTWATPPAGWTLLHAQSENGSGGGFNPSYAIWWKKAGSSEPASYDWTASAADSYTARILSYSGADTTTPIAASAAFQTPSPTTSWAAPSISPASSGMLVCFWGELTGSGALTKPASMTQRAARAYDATYASVLLVADEAVSAGATGTRTATNSAAEYGWMVSIAIGVAGGASPVLSSPTATTTSNTTADISVTTTGTDGTLYAVVTQSSTAPTAAQIIAQQDNTGATAASAPAVGISSSGTKTFSGISFLIPGTTYTAHFVHRSATSVDSNIVSTSSFTMPSGGVKKLTLLGIG